MYKIMGTYQGEREELDSAESLDEANYLLAEYQLAWDARWSIEIVPTSN